MPPQPHLTAATVQRPTPKHPSWPDRRRVLAGFSAAGAVWAVSSAPTAWAQTPALKLGVLPNVSARLLFANYQPLREHLEAALGQAVEIQTAADFKTFQRRTRAGEYDVVVTAANLARVVQIDHQWQPIAQYDPPISGLLVRSKHRQPGGPLGLKGKKLALANPQSLVAMRGFEWLAAQGLKKDIDYQPTLARNDDSLGTLLSSPDTPYAMMSMGEFRAIPESIRADLAIETEFARVPGFVVLASPKLPPNHLSRVATAFLKLGDSAQGKRFFELSGVRAVRAPDAGELQALDPFVAATRAALAD